MGPQDLQRNSKESLRLCANKTTLRSLTVTGASISSSFPLSVCMNHTLRKSPKDPHNEAANPYHRSSLGAEGNGEKSAGVKPGQVVHVHPQGLGSRGEARGIVRRAPTPADIYPQIRSISVFCNRYRYRYRYHWVPGGASVPCGSIFYMVLTMDPFTKA